MENQEKGYVDSIFLREKKDKATHRSTLNLKKNLMEMWCIGISKWTV